MKNRKILWRLCVVAVVFITVAIYSPLITKTGKIEPSVLGLPFSLWTSILLTIIVVFLSYLGGLVLPFKEEDEK